MSNDLRMENVEEVNFKKRKDGMFDFHCQKATTLFDDEVKLLAHVEECEMCHKMWSWSNKNEDELKKKEYFFGKNFYDLTKEEKISYKLLYFFNSYFEKH